MQKPDFLKGRKGITFVDLFAGAGGFSEGFMQAYTDKNYYDFILASDINENCELTHRVRYNKMLGLDTEFICQDIMEDINRLKIVLVEKKRTNKWLSEQLGVSPSTVSKWCTNSSQPDLGSLLRIADVLNVDIKELIVREYQTTYRVLPD